MEKHSVKFYENKELIINCFLDIIKSEGYQNATINRLSQITKLSYGSITNIFHTKECILLEILKRYVEKYDKQKIINEDRLINFISNIVYQMRRIDDDYNLKEIFLEQFTHHKTTEYLKEYISNILKESLDCNNTCYFKAIAIVGIIREYINSDTTLYVSLEKKVDHLVKSILLICEYDCEHIDQIIELMK